MAAFKEKGAAALEFGGDANVGETGQSAALHAQLQAMIDKYGSEVAQLRLDAEGGQLQNPNGPQPSDFPVRLMKRDPHDDVIARKVTAPAALGQKMLTDADLQWLQRKDLQLENLAWRRYMASMFSGASLAERQKLLEVYPDLIREQISVIDERIDLAKRVAHIRLLGPQTEADYRLMFLIASGAIQLPQGEIYDPTSWSDTDPRGSIDAKVARGLFNPSRYNATASSPLHATDLMGDVLANGLAGASAPFGNPDRPVSLGTAIPDINAFFASPSAALNAGVRAPRTYI